MFIHFSTYHFLHLTSDFEDSTPPQSMWLRSGPFQLIWLSSTPRWHTCGQSSHQKPKQLNGRSSYSYSSQDSCRLFGVEMAWPVFSHKLPWSAWAEAPEAKRISDMLLRRGQFVLSLGGSRTTPRLLSVSSPCRPPLRRFTDNPEAPKERTFPPLDSRSVDFFWCS